jgi:predicted nucleic acid-binding protein
MAAQQLREDIVTTEWVLAEVADAMAGSVNRLAAAAFIRDLCSDPNVTVVRASSDWFERGLQLYEQHRDKDWSLTDCISFAIMKKEALTEALTGDHHFAQAGFRLLLG